ncbi:MAG: hypothetical protein QM760_06145 [Nibricoccus sp.]
MRHNKITTHASHHQAALLQRKRTLDSFEHAHVMGSLRRVVTFDKSAPDVSTPLPRPALAFPSPRMRLMNIPGLNHRLPDFSDQFLTDTRVKVQHARNCPDCDIRCLRDVTHGRLTLCSHNTHDHSNVRRPSPVAGKKLHEFESREAFACAA